MTSALLFSIIADNLFFNLIGPLLVIRIPILFLVVGVVEGLQVRDKSHAKLFF